MPNNNTCLLYQYEMFVTIGSKYEATHGPQSELDHPITFSAGGGKYFIYPKNKAKHNFYVV